MYDVKTMASPLGMLKLVANGTGLAAILWENDRQGRVPLGPLHEDAAHPVLRGTETQLAEYFAGCRESFDIKLDLAGTAFQRKVWAALRAIPFGETRTYGALAAAIDRPMAARAVGAACGRNPISIIVPCHRAVGSDGSLTGFAGGLESKKLLLALEKKQAVIATQVFPAPSLAR